MALQGGGGPVGIFDHTKPGRIDANPPSLSGHKGQALDFDFNPFHEHVIATCSDDMTLKIWGIPQEGLTETITEPLAELKGHGRKVTICKFHPTAANVLSSLSGDHTVKLWDIEKGVNMCTFEGHTDLIQDIAWDYLGRSFATSCKDKVVRFVDGRSAEETMSIKDAHEGAKSVKLTFLGSKEKLVSFGFTKQSQRQLKVWDPRDVSKPLVTTQIDQAAGVIMPFYDNDTNILYAAGKGDGNVRYYECVDEKPFCFPLSEYRSTEACKGMTFLPKRACDVMKCETAIALKLTGSTVQPLKFVVPRKSDAFQVTCSIGGGGVCGEHRALPPGDKPNGTNCLVPLARSGGPVPAHVQRRALSHGGRVEGRQRQAPEALLARPCRWWQGGGQHGVHGAGPCG